jgi:WS/DGAT/MGAT family acyltransferase
VSSSAQSQPSGAARPKRAARRLSAEDLSILALENATVAGHTCKVVVVDDPVDPVRLRERVAAHLAEAPDLCVRLEEIDGAPCWVEDPDLDLEAHVVAQEAGPAPDEAGLRATVARLFEQRLDRSRPLWRMDVLPELADGASAIIWRIHHALADGATAMRLARAVLWEEESPASVAAERGARGTRAGRGASGKDAGRLGAGLAAIAREAPQPWRRSPFDGHIGARRSVAFADVELGGLRRAAAAADGATVNDAVLTVVAGGLRRWLEAHHGNLGAVRVKVPVSLHGAVSDAHGDAEAGKRVEPGNRDSFFCLDLPLERGDPLERLAAIRRATRVRKQGHDAQRLDALMRELGRASPRLRRFAEHALSHPRSFALNVSNVPGPRSPVRVLGSPVRALHSLAEIRERHALRVSVVSLADSLNFGLCADPTLVGDVESLAAGMRAEAAALIAHRQP